MHSGLGPVSPNTVLLGWPSDWRNRLKRDNDKADNDESSIADSQALLSCSVNEFVDALKGLGNMQRAICVLKGTRFPRQGDIMPPRSTIDIYWVVDDGGLCLLLSYIISRNPIWLRDSRLRLQFQSTLPLLLMTKLKVIGIMLSNQFMGSDHQVVQCDYGW